MFPVINGVPLHTAFHYHSPYCLGMTEIHVLLKKGLKITSHPSTYYSSLVSLTNYGFKGSNSQFVKE